MISHVFLYKIMRFIRIF